MVRLWLGMTSWGPLPISSPNRGRKGRPRRRIERKQPRLYFGQRTPQSSQAKCSEKTKSLGIARPGRATSCSSGTSSYLYALLLLSLFPISKLFQWNPPAGAYPIHRPESAGPPPLQYYVLFLSMVKAVASSTIWMIPSILTLTNPALWISAKTPWCSPFCRG